MQLCAEDQMKEWFNSQTSAGNSGKPTKIILLDLSPGTSRDTITPGRKAWEFL